MSSPSPAGRASIPIASRSPPRRSEGTSPSASATSPARRSRSSRRPRGWRRAGCGPRNGSTAATGRSSSTRSASGTTTATPRSPSAMSSPSPPTSASSGWVCASAPLWPSRRVVSTGTTGTLTALMEQVVLSGTGQAAAIEGYRVAGKTGTAQKIGPDGRYSHSQHVSSFIGFAPAGAPKVAAIVVLDDPKGAYYGGDVAAPSFSHVMARALQRLRVQPDQVELPT